MLNSTKRLISQMRSENWGGLASMAGSLVLLAAGDMQSLTATAAFLCAEVVLTRFGHKTAGYSAGCAMIAVGGVLLCFSSATEGNFPLKVSILAIAVVWAIGALRYPIEKMGWARTSDAIQPMVGVLALIQRLPNMFLSVIGGNWVMFVATSFYALSDVLTGRVHQFFKMTLRKFGYGL